MRLMFQLMIISINFIKILDVIMGGSPGDVSEDPVTLEKRNKGWRMRCDVGEAT